jgi:hypothetical protein
MPPGAEEALDRLYAAPLERFVALRRELAAELRARGDMKGSSEVAAAKKPSRTAWAINQVVRRSPERLSAAFDAYAAAERAQAEGDAEAMRKTARAYRDGLAEVVRESSGILTESGARVSATQARQMSETIRAAVAGGPGSRSRLMSGRLSEDLDADDPFAGMSHAPARSTGSKGPPAPATREEQRRAVAAEQKQARERMERQRALEEASLRVEALEQEARDARAEARRTDVALVRARDEADRARRAVNAIDERLLAARRAKEKAGG